MSETANDDQRDRADMERLAAGHDAALNDLMERNGARLFHYLLRSVNEEDAEDLAQETFVRVFQNRTKFKVASKFSTWLYTIATNLMRDRFRARQRHPQVSLDASGESGSDLAEKYCDSSPPVPDETMIAGERADQVRVAVQALPEELRTALILYQYEDKSYAEIAEILDCSPKAAEMRLYHARTQLKTRLAHLLQTT